ncbi:MAG: DEAD/DEAH box helicase [Bacteroidales bacterium]|nr:DEAD/DEAH box helicase [Bacteroidales bacterium]
MNPFESLGLIPELTKAVDELGFVNPTPIQQETIPMVLGTNDDVVALAQTGTGKTAAFGLPIEQQLDLESNHLQALVLSPTRELCLQIHKDLESYAKHLPDLKVAAIYGGSDVPAQIKALKNKPHMVAGTPGRVLDMIRRKILKTDQIQWVVLDEADEMLNMGFKEDLDAILDTVPDNKRTLLFSATMPNEVLKIAKKYMHDPVEITSGEKNAVAGNVKHQFYMVHARDRYEALKRIADINPSIYGIVFCRTRQETREVADKLKNDGYNADALHGDLSQAQREYVMKGFRNGLLQMLVATDVAARGIDVSDLTHVINYNLPDEPEVYIHRSGRTGRAGKSGISITIIHTREINKIRNLERLTGKPFEKRPVPTGPEICEKQLFNLVDRMEHTDVDESQISPYMDVIYKKLDWLSREDLIKRFVSVEFNRFLDYYKNAPDLNVKEEKQSAKRKEKEIKPAKTFTRFFINIGTKNKLTPPRMIGLINDYTKRRDLAIGKIDIMKKFTFFEIDQQFEKDILKAFKKAEFDGVNLKVEISRPDTKQARTEAKNTRLKDKKKRKNKR